MNRYAFDTPIGDLGMGYALDRILARGLQPILTLGQLAAAKEVELLSKKEFGMTRLRVVRRFLEENRITAPTLPASCCTCGDCGP